MPGIILSDGVIIEHGTGKRSLIGCFEQFNVSKLPVTLGKFQVTTWITNIEGEHSELRFTFRIHPRGSAHIIFSAEGILQLGTPRQITRDQCFGVSAPIHRITFDAAATYVIDVLVGEEQVAQREFRVNLRTSPDQ